MLALLVLLLLAVSCHLRPASADAVNASMALLGRQRFVNCALRILGRSHRASNSYIRESKWSSISQVYLTHWTKRPDRLQFALKTLQPYNVMPALITQFDKEVLRHRDVLCFNPAFSDFTWKECPDLKLQVRLWLVQQPRREPAVHAGY